MSEKETVYVKKDIIDIMVDELGENPLQKLMAHIREAEMEGLREGIKANTVLINENMVKVKPFIQAMTGGVLQMPPMFCGLNTYFTTEDLPDGYSFAVCEAPQKPELDICGAIDYIYERTWIDQAVLQKVLELAAEYMDLKTDDGK